MSWSSGKDSTFALQAVRRDPEVTVSGLLVTVNAEADRVAMHAVRRSLLESQASRLGLPLHVVEIPSPCPNDLYEAHMSRALDAAARDGVDAVVFGDLFLEDIRQYREQALEGTGIQPLFPLWSRPTRELAQEMIDDGVRAVLTCVDPSNWTGHSSGEHSTGNCSVTCRPRSTRAGNEESFIPSCGMGPDSAPPSRYVSARWSRSMDSSSAMSSPRKRESVVMQRDATFQIGR